MKKRTLVLGVTGSFASGKTTVAWMFQTLGASRIDADRIYHELIRPPGSLYKKIISSFGREILGKTRQIDRKKLGKIAFSKRGDLRRLTQITHPGIIRKIREKNSQLKRTKKCRIIVIDAPLLIEAGLISLMDKLIVVKANKKNQISRCKKRKGLSRVEVIKRIRRQIPLTKKIKLADYVIDNNGTLKQTREQVRNIWKKL